MRKAISILQFATLGLGGLAWLGLGLGLGFDLGLGLGWGSKLADRASCWDFVLSWFCLVLSSPCPCPCRCLCLVLVLSCFVFSLSLSLFLSCHGFVLFCLLPVVVVVLSGQRNLFRRKNPTEGSTVTLDIPTCFWRGRRCHWPKIKVEIHWSKMKASGQGERQRQRQRHIYIYKHTASFCMRWTLRSKVNSKNHFELGGVCSEFRVRLGLGAVLGLGVRVRARVRVRFRV